MQYKFEITETGDKHCDLVDSTIYAYVAKRTAEFTDYYLLLHIQKPRWCPLFIYHFFIKHFVNLTEFKK
jgi:hypothetical protein